LGTTSAPRAGDRSGHETSPCTASGNRAHPSDANAVEGFRCAVPSALRALRGCRVPGGAGPPRREAGPRFFLVGGRGHVRRGRIPRAIAALAGA
jgi:hypothetical protein